MSNEAPCRYCGHWDAPNDEKTYCLKHYRRTFPDKGCDICELQAQLAELREAQRWIPCNERLPESTGEWLAVRHEPDHHPEIGIYLYDEDADYPGGEWPYGSYITHWMPLPLPPEEGK